MNEKHWSQIVAKAWADPKFKQRLVSNPSSVLKEHGVTVPAGVTVKVIENTDNVVHLTLPVQPSGELSDDELAEVAAAGVNRLITD
jgi:hypothetical protein